MIQATASADARSTHWARPDIARDLLAVAQRPGAAPPRAVHVRPELLGRMLAHMDPAVRAAVERRGSLGEGTGIPLVVDAELPLSPGFEVVRARPDEEPRPYVATA